MAGLGDFHTLSQSELKTAFDEAKADGKDYLVKLEYTSCGVDRTVLGAMIDVIDFRQASLGVEADSMYDDFKAFVVRYGGGDVEAVYDLNCDFKAAVMSQEQSHEILESFSKAEYQVRMEARPLWRKVLGLQPK